MKDQSELESRLQPWLDELRQVPPRNPQTAARARAHFLGQAVSASEFQRHKGWKSIFRKERFAMNMILSILVIAGLLFGGGATVNAAQDDLPNEPLYPVKTLSEDVSLQLQGNPQKKVERLMELAQVRMQEMTRLTEAGQSTPDQVRLRLEQHIQQALQICSSLEDAALDQALLQIRDRLQQQDRDMEQLQLHAGQDIQPTLIQMRSMLQQRLHLVDEGLQNHEMFRNAIRNGFRYGQEEDGIPPVQNGNGTQNGQPTTVPGGPNNQYGNPSLTPAGPNTPSGGSNTDPGGPNMSTTPSPSKDGSGSGGNGPGGGMGGNDSGGSGAGGNGSGGGGSGGSGSGGGGSNSNRP